MAAWWRRHLVPSPQRIPVPSPCDGARRSRKAGRAPGNGPSLSVLTFVKSGTSANREVRLRKRLPIAKAVVSSRLGCGLRHRSLAMSIEGLDSCGGLSSPSFLFLRAFAGRTRRRCGLLRRARQWSSSRLRCSIAQRQCPLSECERLNRHAARVGELDGRSCSTAFDDRAHPAIDGECGAG